ncbi:hypothetical protein [Roseivirga thermotolerans]|uniref:hypothetical protein n=1 Tax=Roseivirga thermotolerans TaxID=1758176 RepID=UPI00273FFEAF|nr:hypothetical protein [Roseivirga thermotolerans]
MSDQEKKDKRFSIVVSAIIHSSLIALFLILVAWRAPDPPLPEYGIELNLGFQEAGSGDIERNNKAEIEETENDTPPDAESDTDNSETKETEQQVEQKTEKAEVKQTPQEQPKTTPVTEKPKEAPPVEQTVKETVTSPEKSEVKVEEKTTPVTETKKETTTPPKQEETKKEEVKPKVEEKKEEPKPKPVIDNRALMGGKKTNTDSKEKASNNQGTQTDTRGNMGDPKGKANTKGTDPGGADLGVSYSLDGWKWQSPPAEKDDSQIDGVIKFSIEVDDRGKVLRATIIPGTTISDNTVVDFYRKQVLNLKFIQTDMSKAPAPISKGEVTFVIKTN